MTLRTDSQIKNQQRQREAENVLKALEKPFAKKFYRITKAFYQRALADHLKHGGNFTAIFNYYKQQMFGLEALMAGTSIKLFVGNELTTQKRASLILETKDQKRKASYVQGIYQDYMHKYGAQQVRYITDTSKSDIQDTLSDLDSTPAELTESVMTLIGSSLIRGALIARTETHNAGQFGAIEAVKNLAADTGTTFSKAWVSSQDERTRPDHIAIDPTNYIPLHDLFDVGDTQMDRPGDPNGGPAQVCNCRCVVIMEESDLSGAANSSVRLKDDAEDSDSED